jgi:hypothetical protein
MLLKRYQFFLYCWLYLPGCIAADRLPGFFEVTYTLHSKGTQFAEMNRSFTHAGNGKYIFRSVTHATGFFSLFRKDNIIEESQWSVNEPQLRPLHYTYQHTGGKKDRYVDIVFDWDNNKITNKVGDSIWYMQLQPEILDKLLYQLAIMRDLERGKSPQSYTIADGGKIKSYQFELLGGETIQTPIGDLQTVKLARYKPNSQRKTIFWCAVTLNHLPIKVENTEKDGRITTALIKSLKGLGDSETTVKH